MAPAKYPTKFTKRADRFQLNDYRSAIPASKLWTSSVAVDDHFPEKDVDRKIIHNQAADIEFLERYVL